LKLIDNIFVLVVLARVRPVLLGTLAANLTILA